MSIPAGVLVFISNWWKLAAGIIVGALICYPFALNSGKDAGRKEVQLQVETANRLYLEQKARADELAARERVVDQNAVRQQVEVLLNAIRDIPDSTPSAISIRLGCERLLRAASGNQAAVPAICRSQGGIQANPTP